MCASKGIYSTLSVFLAQKLFSCSHFTSFTNSWIFFLFCKIAVLFFIRFSYLNFPCCFSDEGSHDSSIPQISGICSKNLHICRCCRGRGGHYIGHLSFIQEMTCQIVCHLQDINYKLINATIINKVGA